MKYLDRIDIARALQKAASKGQMHYMTIQVLAKTGVRVTELINIRPQDILYSAKQIIIRGKGNKIRNIDIPDELLYLLQFYIKDKKIRKNKPIFPVTKQAIYYRTKQIADVNPHAFRHSYAIQLLRKTKNIKYVQQQLGHSTLATTQVYLKYMDFDKEKGQLGELWS